MCPGCERGLKQCLKLVGSRYNDAIQRTNFISEGQVKTMVMRWSLLVIFNLLLYKISIGGAATQIRSTQRQNLTESSKAERFESQNATMIVQYVNQNFIELITLKDIQL